MAQPRLEPFADDMLRPSERERVLGFLRGLGLPPHIAASHLGRWAAYVGVRLEPYDYKSVGIGIPRPPGR